MDILDFQAKQQQGLMSQVEAMQQQLVQRSHVALQQQQIQRQQRDDEAKFSFALATNTHLPMEHRITGYNNYFAAIGQPQLTVRPEDIDTGAAYLTQIHDNIEKNPSLSAKWAQQGLASGVFSPRQMPEAMKAMDAAQEQQVQTVAESQVPAVEGAQEARGSTQEARGRLALFDSLANSQDPDAPQKVEAFTKVYGSTKRLHQQIEADKLVIQADDLRTQEREKFASALRMAPAELAKQAAAQLDPKTMLLPLISKAIQEKGLEGLNQQDRNRIDAFYTINGQPDKLAVFSEGSKVNELKRYQQDLQDTKVQLGAIEQVQSVMAAGKERIDTYEAAAQDALSLVENHGAKMSTTSYEQRQAALEQLKTGTAAVMQDWEETIAPVRDELTKGATNAQNTVKQLDEQMRRPGVDRVTLSKRKDFALQTAEIYERMNNTLGLYSDVDLALKRNEIRALEIDAKTGESAEARESAQALIPKKKQELTMLAQQVEKNKASIELDRERLSRFAKLSQARITAGDKKLEQAQQNGTMASAFLSEWTASGFKLSPDTWAASNGKFFEGYDPKMFMDVVKPALDSRKELSQGRAEQELLRSGDAKQAGPIAAKYGVKPSDILGVLKDPNRPLADVKIYNEKQTVDQAGKLANINQAISEIKSVRQVFVNPDGTINRAQILAGTLGVPFTAGKGAEQLIERSIEIKLRAATGAAARPDELKLYGRLFGPSTIDSDEMIRYKLDSLENWMGAVADTTDPTGDLRKRAESMMAKGTIQQLTTPEYAELRKKFPQASSQDIIRFLQSRKAQP